MPNVNPQALARPASAAAAQQQVRDWEVGTSVLPTATQIPTAQTQVPQTQTVNP